MFCSIFTRLCVVCVQLLNCVWLFVTPWTAAHQASLSFTITRSVLKLTSIKSAMPSNPFILCHPLLLLPSIFPSLWVFPMSQLLSSGCQRTRASASASVLPMNIQGWFLLRLTGLSSLLSKGLSRVFSSTTVWKHQFFSTQPSLWSSSHIHTWLLEKPQLWKYGPLSPKWCFYSFNTLSRLVSFSSKEQASFNFVAAVTIHSDFGAQEK